MSMLNSTLKNVHKDPLSVHPSIDFDEGKGDTPTSVTEFSNVSEAVLAKRIHSH